MFGLGPTEIIIIAGIVFLIFGAKRLPEIGKGLGGAIREFKQVGKDLGPKETIDKGQEERDPPALEEKVAGKIVEQVPGVKKVMDVKKGVETVKKIID